MTRTQRTLLPLAALVLACSAASTVAAQSVAVKNTPPSAGETLIRKAGTSNPIPNPEFKAPKHLVYKVSWDVTVGPATPDSAVAGFSRVANFLVMADDAGVPRRNVHLALIVHGTATQSLLNNEAYKKATGADNANVALLQALHDAGVQVIVCGQALVNRKVPRDQLLPFVKVSTSATMARAILHAQGYANFSP